MQEARIRQPKPILFVCIAQGSSRYISEVIAAPSQKAATSQFVQQHHIQPDTIYGPFRAKRLTIPITTQSFKFAGPSFSAIYQSWQVNAFQLQEPANHAYLVFLVPLPNTKPTTPPKGTVIVPIEELTLVHQPINLNLSTDNKDIIVKKSFLKKVKSLLLQQKEELLAQSKSEVEVVDADGDEADEIQAKLLVQVSNQLNNRNQAKLQQIEEALSRIANNNYGLCLDCEENIPEKRLLLNPHFQTCIDCAEDREQTEQRHRSQGGRS